jgi:hypothetical protein
VDARTLARIHDLYAADYTFLGFDPDDVHLTGTLDAAVLSTLNREVEHNVRAEVLHAAATRTRDGLTRRPWRSWSLPPRRTVAL